MTSGLIKWHTAEGMYLAAANTLWLDRSGLGAHSSITAATVTELPNAFPGNLSALTGDATSRITIFSTLSAPYTLFHITRWGPASTTSQRNRIVAACLDGATSSSNWLSGHWGDWNTGSAVPRSGIAVHNAWITAKSGDLHGTNWVLSSDQNALYRSQAIDRTTAKPSGLRVANLCINHRYTYVGGSDPPTTGWQVGHGSTA